VKPEMEDEFNQWYDQEHILICWLFGDIWAKRGINTGKGPKYVAVYEHENIDVQHTKTFRKTVDTEWTRKISPQLLRIEREVYELL
jgi:hypothetical protein